MNKPIHYATSKLKQYRDDRDWSQQQMADYLMLQLNKEISRSTIQKWENGERGITADMALEISKVTKIPVMELVARREA